MRHLRLMCTWMIAYALLVGIAKAQDVVALTYPADALAQLEETQTTAVALAAGKLSIHWGYIANRFSTVGAPSKDFQRGMEHNKSLLAIAAADPDDPLSVTLVRNVEEDLAIKANYISEVETLAAAAFSEVAVEVKTKRKDQEEVDGYFIGFSPKHLTGSDPMYRFNNPTSPTSGNLPPGRYEMIAILADQVVQRQEVSIGIHGQQRQAITCLVP